MSNLEITTAQFRELSVKEQMSVVNENLKLALTKLDAVGVKQDYTNGKVKWHTKAIVGLWTALVFTVGTIVTLFFNKIFGG